MFQIHVGSTPCELTQQDYRTLAKHSEGYVFDTMMRILVNSTFTNKLLRL